MGLPNGILTKPRRRFWLAKRGNYVMSRNTASFAIVNAAQRSARSTPRGARRYRTATALAGGLAATILLAFPAAAQDTHGGHGGRGQSTSTPPAGGTGSTTGTGQAGAAAASFYQGGAGGGAGATGGAGGTDFMGNAGGAGGATPGAGGFAGASGSYASGGGGGAHGTVLLTTTTPGADITGGRGGNGGNASVGDGGGGGAGGYGVVVDTGGTLVFDHLISGGNGGNGGNGYFYGGGGGDGGHGLLFTGPATATLNGAVTGGNGGTSGIYISGTGVLGTPGNGGIGIVGSDVSLTLNAAVSGGLGGDGVTRALALYLGGISRITLGTSWNITGGIQIANGDLTIVHNGDETLDNVISGAGLLAKIGIDTLTLTGANTYSGGTFISNGTLQIGDGGTIGVLGGGDVTNYGVLAFNRSNNISVSNNISGTGDLAKYGAGILTLTGGNTYSGNTHVYAGTLAIGAPGAASYTTIQLDNGTTLLNAISIGSRTISNGIQVDTGNAATIDSGGGVSTLSGAINGDGDLTFQNGSFILSGANAYGATTIASGTALVVGAGLTSGTLGTGAVTVDGLLVLNRSDDVTVSNEVNGNGTLRKTAGGTLILTGANSYLGGTEIQGGTLQVGDGGTTGELGSGGVVNDFTLAFNRSDDISFSQDISGTGVVVKLGAGALTLSGNNTYLGSTTISDGTLVLGSATAYGAGNILLDGGTLDIGAFGFDLRHFDGGTGTIISSGGGTLDVASGQSVTFGSSGGAITTAAGLAVDATSTLTLLGNNDLTGGIVVAGRLVIGESGAAGGSPNSIVTVGSVISYADGVDNGTSILLASDSTQLEVLGSDFATQSGIVYEDASVRGFEKIGTGTLILTAANSYSGTTLVSAGTLGLGDDLAAGTGTIALADGSTLLTSVGCGCGALTLTNAIDVVSGTATIDTDGYETVLSGSLTGGNLIFADTYGGGTTILTGANSYGDTTVQSSAMLQIGDGGTTGTLGTGSITTEGMLAFNRSDSVTLSTTVGGTGFLGQFGTGTLILIADNSYSGGTVIMDPDGTLQVGDGGTAGTLGAGQIAINGGTLIFNRSDDLSVEGDILGDGQITKLGAGTLTLSGDNSSYGGTLSALAGTIAFTDTGLGSGLVEVDNGATLKALEDAAAGYVTILSGGGTIDTDSYTFEVVGGVDFQGELTKTGSGTLILADFFEEGTGAGGINVTAGTLGLGSDFAAGTGLIKLANGTTLLNAACGCSDLNVDNAIQIALGGIVTFDADGANMDMNGAISGGDIHFTTSSFAPFAGSVFELNGANSYGATLIGPNVAVIVRDGTLGTGNVTFDATPSDPTTPAALVFQNGVDYSYGGRIIGAGVVSVEADPANSVTLTGSNTSTDNFTGAVEVISGRLVINGDFGDVVGNSAALLVDDSCFCGGPAASLGGSGIFHGNVTIGAGTLNPGNSPGTLGIAGNLTLGAATILDYELGAPGSVGGVSNDLVNVGGDLTLEGTLNTIASGAGYGPGYYRLFNYGGTLVDNGVAIGAIAGGLDATVLTNIGGQVNVRLGGTQAIQYWDGADFTGASDATGGNGGAGTWSASTTNWTGPAGYAINDAWESQVGVFAGAAGGIVTVDGVQSFEELRFETDGYQLLPIDANARLETTGGFSIVDVSSGLTADIGVIIQGAAGLDKTGDGTLILSAVNAYTGATDIAAGTLRMGIAKAISRNSDVSVSAGATLELDDYLAEIGSLGGGGTVTLGTAGLNLGYANTSTTFSGDLSGSGDVHKKGGGIFTLTGSISLTDADPNELTIFAVDSGMVAVGSSGSLTAEFVQNFGTLTNAGSITTSGTIQSFGTFTNHGAAIGVLQNFGTFDNNATGMVDTVQNLGGTATNAGTINLSAANFATFVSTGIINGELSNFSVVQLEGQLNAGLANVSSGATVTLTGAVTGITYYGGADGSLFDLAGFDTQVGGLTSTGAIQLGTATLTLGGTNPSSNFNGVISGSGGLIKIGTETQTLNGLNDYTGATAVNAGELDIGYGGAIISDVTIAGGATFANNGSVTGLVTNNGTLTTIGTIASVGPVALINNGGGQVVAEGQINGAVQNSGTFSSTAGLTGITDFSQTAGGTLTLGYHLDLGTLNGSGIVDLGISTLTIGAGGLSSTFDGVISGDGRLTKAGSGTLTLGGTNSYTWQTLVDDGTLVVSSTGTIAGEVVNNASLVSTGTLSGGLTNNGTAAMRGVLGGLVQNQSGSITLTGATTGDSRFVQSSGALFDLAGFDTSLGSLNGDGIVSLGGGTLTVGSRNTNMDFAGVITGTGGLTKTGEGTLTLTGASTYGGVTMISDGTLLLADGGSIGGGNVFVDANLAFDGTIDRTFGNVIQGSGGVIKAGATVLTLTGVNSHAGGSTVTGGTLAFDNSQALGTGVVRLGDGTALRNAQGGAAVTLGNDIAGAAGGTVTLEGVGGADTTLGGELSDGNFRFAVSGGGTTAFTLTSANYYDDTQIGTGVSLSVAGSGTLGSGNTMLDSAASTLTFANATNYTYGGTIIGGGAIVVDTAPGVSVTLSGSNSSGSDFTGTVSVDAGKLVLGGDFGDLTGNTASLTLNGGSLGGSGTFHGDVTVGSGTLSPGNSPGTLVIAGNLNLGTGTILNYELSESGTPGGVNNDLINVGGNLTLDGTLNVTALAGFGEGYYRLFNYGGTFTDNGLNFGALPAGYTSTLLTNIGGQVNILFASSPQAIQYWDGSDLTGGTPSVGGNGGAGVWSGTNTNWTAPTGWGVNDGWRGQVAVFGGASGGNVTVQGIQAFQELRFTTDGYAITGAAADGLATTGGFSVVDVSGGVDATIDAAISGAGGLTKTGTGTLGLGGTNSYSGVTTVSDGTLVLTASGSLAGGVVNDAVFNNQGIVTGQVVNNASMTSTGTLNGGLNNSGAASISGVLNGAVANTSSGTITLTGTTTGIGAVTQSGNGSFNLAGFDTSFGSLAGTGTVALGSATLTTGGDNSSTSFGGTISGSGGLTKTGTGIFTLTGANSYAGLTTVSAGTLQLSGSGSIAGAVRNDATFNNAGTVAGLVTNNATLTSIGTLASGLTNNGTASLAGTVTGAVANGGSITLIGATTGIGAVTQTASGSIALGGFNTSFTSLAGAGSVNLGSATLTLGGAAGTVAFNGGITGSGGLTKAGTGTQVLNGTNSYTGLTAVTGGTLAMGTTGSIAGNVLNQATFSSSGTVTGMVQNDGTLTSTGTIAGGLLNNGTATLQGTVGTGIVNNGTITFSRATTVAAVQQAATGTLNIAGLGGSTLSLGTLTGSGAVILNVGGSLTIGAGNGNSSFAGTISGSGSLTKAGAGTLVLTGAATQTDGTTIAGGALQIGAGGTTGSLSGAITNNGVLVLSRSDAVTLANVMSGTGGFVQAGTGTTTLTGANSYSGGTLVSTGRLRGDTTSLQGAIKIDSALEFAQTSAGTYAGNLSGAGVFEKTGVGALALTGNSSTFTGTTNVIAGQMAINGLLSHSTVTVNNGATVGGIGTVGGLVVQSGGTIAPGNSVGTFNVAGNVLFQAGSLFAAEVQASGSDKIQATGTAQLNGTLQVINLGGNYGINSSFVLLHADSGLSGTFATTNLASFGLAYRPKIIYTANEVQLFLAPNQLSAVLGTGVSLTYNQASTIGRIDGAVVTGGYDPVALSALYSLAPAAIPAALDQLSGEIYADATRAALEDERVVREAVVGRLAEAADLGVSGNGAWGQLIGSWGSVDSDGNAAGYDVNRTGMLMGIDAGSATEEGSWRAGVMGHYTRITVPADARGSRATIDRTGGGFYAGAAMGGWRVRTGASLSLLDLKARRNIAIPGLSTTERRKKQGVMLQTFGEISYQIETGAHGFVEPYLAGSATRVSFGRFAESSGPVSLMVRAQKSVLGIAELGLRGEMPLASNAIRLGGNIGLRTAFGDRTANPVIALTAAPDQAFNVHSAEIARFAAAANLNLTADLSDTLSLRIGYSGVLASGAREHGGRATLSLKF
jgi:fibronectin-binding autotransporter adhesin